MQEVYKAIGRVADQNINVLIRGESGTGKELVARAIHQHSNRAGKEISCRQLCGNSRSALGKRAFRPRKRGFYRGREPTHRQVRGVQRRHPLPRRGGRHAAADAEQGPARFRRRSSSALAETKRSSRTYGLSRPRIAIWTPWWPAERSVPTCAYRLNGYSILLPPLRDRRDDIPLLVEYYVRLFNSEIGKAITDIAPETMERLKQYSWPGNIRELQTVLKHAMLHAIGPVLVPEFLPPELRELHRAASFPPPPRPAAAAEDVPSAQRGRCGSSSANTTALFSMNSWRTNFALGLTLFTPIASSTWNPSS